MRAKKKFICQINAESLLVISWQIVKGKPANVKTEIEPLTPDLTDSQISESLNGLFKKLGLNRESIIISLPRILATCRYLKLPSTESAEIERMARFQASCYLPYSVEELISGYSLIRRVTRGYSFINLVIVHKAVIERFLNILGDRRGQVEAIFLSSYGLVYWYRRIKPKQQRESVMLLNIDLSYAEIAIVYQGNLLFSRAFKLPAAKFEFRMRLVEEIDKTLKSYQKETAEPPPTRVILTGLDKELLENIKDLELNLPMEYITGSPLAAIAEERVESRLNLLPSKEKEDKRKISLRKEYLKIACFVFGIIFFLSLGFFNTFYNKKAYLNRLKQELEKNSPQVKVIEDMEKRTKIISAQIWQMSKTVDVLYEVYKFLPEGISLTTLTYEGDSRVVLRGQTQNLSTVFNAVSIFEKSEFFSNVKVNYATRKKTQAGEVIDFEIVCQMTQH